MGETQLVLKDWKFKACRDKEWRPAVVPGCVHTDLLREGIIADPFYGTNERNMQWIDKIDWEYETAFDVSAELMKCSSLELVFDGLDTYADVYVNGAPILSADNMFRTWRVNVKSLVAERNNVLNIRFRSPVQEDLPKIEKLGYNLPSTNDQSELGEIGEQKVSVFARKAPYHYGWDWGPRLVTSGIWREVRLEGWSDCRISDLFVEQKSVSAAEAQLVIHVEIESEQEGQGKVRIVTAGEEWKQDVSLQPGTNIVQVPAVIAEPELWWSRGLGAARLYAFTAEILREEKQAATCSVRTGLRTVRLVRNKDEAGASFYFELNGVPVFAKGANHIPGHSFIPEVTEEHYRHEIATAVESNMNMLRVWGGGIYEQAVFYELCDEQGILVWQDFMFACSMYPGDEPFLNNVRLEAEENVKRLRNHPSIALWCGNNEIDIAWAMYDEHGGWGWKQSYDKEQRNFIWNSYESIFHEILPKAVATLQPDVDYWPSSPMISLSGDINQHSRPLTTEGDIHYWGVWHMLEPFDHYNKKIGRFMSEYGFQSFPEYSSVLAFAAEEELKLDSEVLLAHQRSPDGNRLIQGYMNNYMGEPKDFPSFLYMSQVLQAEAMKTAIEAHRRAMPYCMGSLYWQMNDCWPAASWSGLDYYGKWKAMQYYAKASLADSILSFDRTEDGKLCVHAITDLLAPFIGTLRVRLYDFNGVLLKEAVESVAVEGNSAAVVYSVDECTLVEKYDRGSVMFLAELDQEGELVDRKLFYFLNTKELKLGSPAIQLSEVEGSGGTRYVLETDKLAKQVWLTATEDGRFSDNFFDLIPGIPKTVEFRRRTSGEMTSRPTLPGRINVCSMADCLAGEADNEA
ncbi:beta-mannosidase [Paenibacillus sp. IHBB 3054]|uniref:beta-mannosidase n=1 Tax=Paenibacillus sp. IHBB 3054 TaxID=3425689 RepID=UPI003F676EAF